MNITKSLENWLAYSYQKIWNNGKIATRPLSLVILLPLTLSAFGAWFKLHMLDSGTPPFLFFFVVVTLSTCYGGIRGSFVGTGLTTLFSLIMLLFAESGPEFMWLLSVFQVLLYCAQCLFLTALLYGFHKNEQRCALQYEDALKAKEEIQAREKLHEDFVHMATHELKAPVTVLKAYLQLAEMKLRISPQEQNLKREAIITSFQELTSKMNFQLDKLVALINDLLESTRVKAGALNCQISTFDLKRCLNDCVEGFRAAQPDANIDCSLPEEEVFINGDEVRIEQVILNLLSNAVKYSPGQAHVQVSCIYLGDEVLIKVKDHGMGIPHEMLQAVFSRFVRVKSPEMSKYPGLGLGLYISAELIKVHGGEIKVESEVGRGSTFSFSLPVHKLG